MLNGNDILFKCPVECKKNYKSLYFYWNFGNRWILCAHPLLTNLILDTRRPNNQEIVSYVLDYEVSADVPIFAFWRAEKHVFHIVLFRSTSCVLRCFGCLEVNNSVSHWNKAKKPIFGRSILQMSQLEISLFIYKLRCQSSLWTSISYGFCEFNRVATCNKGKTIILERSSFQICRLEILVSYST